MLRREGGRVKGKLGDSRFEELLTEGYFLSRVGLLWGFSFWRTVSRGILFLSRVDQLASSFFNYLRERASIFVRVYQLQNGIQTVTVLLSKSNFSLYVLTLGSELTWYHVCNQIPCIVFKRGGDVGHGCWVQSAKNFTWVFLLPQNYRIYSNIGQTRI